MTRQVDSVLVPKVLDHIRAEIPTMEEHLVGTSNFALEINRNQDLGYTDEQVALAALCHDLARLYTKDELVHELVSRGIDPDSFGFSHPILLHGYVSEIIAVEKFGISDENVLSAIRKHTTGEKGMNVLDKLIYVSDKIESSRSFPGIDELREIARKDIVEAFPRVIARVISMVVARQFPLYYNSVEAYNEAISGLSDRNGLEL
ncbi:bis(5'-nucleosyl)-tetraphosphatase (symmetrical) YqeK [bacterium]|nr:bis(5'-nucleosyl)-tetraphosphatase (symmetrical) YqeK [bacterium]